MTPEDEVVRKCPWLAPYMDRLSVRVDGDWLTVWAPNGLTMYFTEDAAP